MISLECLIFRGMRNTELLDEIDNAIGSHEKNIIELNLRREVLINSRQPQVEELFKHLNKYISHSVVDKTYEHILGGDGRSRPWSEEREGKVLVINSNPNVYIDSTIKGLVIGYLKTFYGETFDHIETNFI